MQNSDKHRESIFGLSIHLVFSLLVSLHSLNGYAESRFFGTEEIISVIVEQPYIEMRTGPGRGYPIFHIAERGDKVDIIKRRTDWFKVRTQAFGLLEKDRNSKLVPGSNTKTGWVHIDQIAKVLDGNQQPINISKPALNDFYQRSWEAGIMAGSFGGADEISLYGGYYFTKNISAEVTYSESFGDFSNGKAATLSIVHHPFPEWRYSPFFTLGGGTRQTDPKSNLVSTTDRTDDSVHVGLGVSVYITRRIMLRAQYKNHVVLTDRDDDEGVDEWKIGLSAFF